MRGAVESKGFGMQLVAEGTKKAFDCPECRPGTASFATPELLGVHLERHRPVDPPSFSTKGKPTSLPCPVGCGRHFALSKAAKGEPAELRHHKAICDGSPPIVGQASAAPETGQAEEISADQAAPPPPEEKKEAIVLECGKGCGKKFIQEGAWKQKHEEKCGGPGSAPAAPPKARRTPRAAARGTAKGPAAGSMAGILLAQLREKREEIIAGIPELQEIDRLIKVLEEAGR
jgi:hypothetical protein